MAHTTENVTGYKAYTATAVAIGQGVRVKLDSSGNISAAGATDAWIGTTVSPIPASGTGSVRLRNAPGTHLFVASAAISAGALLYATASGKVDDAAGTSNFTGFQAEVAAGADGDIISAVPADTLAFTASAAQAAVGTTSATNSSPYGYATAAQADAIVTLVNALRTACINAGIIKGSA